MRTGKNKVWQLSLMTPQLKKKIKKIQTFFPCVNAVLSSTGPYWKGTKIIFAEWFSIKWVANPSSSSLFTYIENGYHCPWSTHHIDFSKFGLLIWYYNTLVYLRWFWVHYIPSLQTCLGFSTLPALELGWLSANLVWSNSAQSSRLYSLNI